MPAIVKRPFLVLLAAALLASAVVAVGRAILGVGPFDDDGRAGTTRLQWGNVTIDFPDPDGGVVVVPWEAPAQIKPPDGGLAITIRRTDDPRNSHIVVDAETGAVLVKEVAPEDAASLEAVASTVKVEEPNDAAWPLGPVSTGRPRTTLDNISFLEPDPESGIQWSLVQGGTTFLEISNGRSKRGYDTQTGAVTRGGLVKPEDREVFDRFGDAIIVGHQ